MAKLISKSAYEDSDKDGMIDTWKTDVDGDGRIDRTIQVRVTDQGSST